MTVSFDTYRVTGMYRFAVLTNVASVVTETAIPFSNGATFKNDVKTISYEGDGQKAKKYLLEQVDVEVKADEIGAAALQSIYAKTAVTASLPADATVRLYFGDNGDSSGINCGVAAYVTAEKLSSGANVKLRIVAPRGTLGSPEAPDFKSRDKAGLNLKFAANKATTDIAGAALPGVPTDGCFWYMEELL